MRVHRRIASALTVLIFAGLAACDRAPHIAGPFEDAPQFARASASANGNGHSRVTTATVRWTQDFSGAEAQATLSSGGGTLEIVDANNGNAVIVALHVPGGAAPGGLIDFAMNLICDAAQSCAIDLTATRNGRDASQFRKGVQLWINTAYLDVPAGTTLGVAELLPDGGLSVVPSRTTADGFLIGTLRHFSAYVPITD